MRVLNLNQKEISIIFSKMEKNEKNKNGEQNINNVSFI